MLLKDFRIDQLHVSKDPNAGLVLTYGAPRNPVILQTPVVYAPYGVCHRDGGSSPWIELELSEGSDKLIEIFLAIDNKILQAVSDNSHRWIGEPLSRDRVYERFKPTVRLEEGNIPSIRLRLSGNPIVYGKKGSQTDISDLVSGTLAKYLIHVQSVWFPDMRIVGTTLRLVQAAVVGRQSMFAFVDDI